VSTAPLRLVAAEPDWREALQTAVRPEFRVVAYVPDPDDPWLYGSHCAVGGCELPIRRPLNGPGGVYVCNAHLHNYRDHGPRDVQAWLGDARPLRAQHCRRPSYRCGLRRSAQHVGSWQLKDGFPFFLCQVSYRRSERPVESRWLGLAIRAA
jgi:hypothetical protein